MVKEAPAAIRVRLVPVVVRVVMAQMALTEPLPAAWEPSFPPTTPRPLAAMELPVLPAAVVVEAVVAVVRVASSSLTVPVTAAAEAAVVASVVFVAPVARVVADPSAFTSMRSPILISSITI